MAKSEMIFMCHRGFGYGSDYDYGEGDGHGHGNGHGDIYNPPCSKES